MIKFQTRKITGFAWWAMRVGPALVLVMLSFAGAAFGAQAPGEARAAAEKQASGGNGAGENQAENYILGPDDSLIIRALDVEEIGDKPVQIDLRGNINLPLVGRVHAGGLTSEQLETSIADRLKQFVQHPQVTVSVAEFRSQPVSVLGEVVKPGVHQLQGRKNLFEILSLAGGLKPEAGYRIKITRAKEWGAIPLPSAVPDSTGNYSVAEVDIKSVMEARNPQENILIKPNDVISVPRAKLIYVTGAVKKAGGYVLGDRETMSVLQALSLAEGLDHTTASMNAHILRTDKATEKREEIPVDLKKLFAGKDKDMPLEADDILFVPTSAGKNVAMRTLEAAIQMGTGIAIYRR